MTSKQGQRPNKGVAQRGPSISHSQETSAKRLKEHIPRIVKPKHHDTYVHRKKSADAFVCDQCGVVSFGGKWRWGAPPLADVHGGLCPACERIRDRYPAGTLTIPASLVGDREELIGLIGNIERRESAEHPLERVIRIEESEEGATVTTTGIHLARCLASKLSRRFGRKAKLRYPEEQHLLFASWEA
jgi:hypothetical protein